MAPPHHLKTAPWSLRATHRALALAEPTIHTQLGRSPRLAWSLPEARGPFPHPGSQPWIWLHAASGGDVRALQATARHLRGAFPDALLYLTAVTPTGYDAGREALQDGWVDAVRAAPITMPDAIAQLWLTPPAAALIERLELWPALLAPLAHHRIPWVLHNARLSHRSATAYASLAPAWWPWLLRSLKLALVQEPATAARLIGLVPTLDGRTQVTPSPKIAASTPPEPGAIEELRTRYLLHPGRSYLVAGSLHEAELKQALQGHDGRPLLLAPRYPEQAGEFVDQLRALGLSASRMSELQNTQIKVLDRFGELPALYGLARWSLIGGTLSQRGGHNPLEALVAGSPVVVGESTEAIEPLLTTFRSIPGAVVEHSARPGWPHAERAPPDPDTLTEEVARRRVEVGATVGAVVERALRGAVV